MNIALAFNRWPVLPRLSGVIERGIAPQKLTPEAVKGEFMKRGDRLAWWAERHGLNLTQVSLAIHGRRTDRRSREILSALKKEINR